MDPNNLLEMITNTEDGGTIIIKEKSLDTQRQGDIRKFKKINNSLYKLEIDPYFDNIIHFKVNYDVSWKVIFDKECNSLEKRLLYFPFFLKASIVESTPTVNDFNYWVIKNKLDQNCEIYIYYENQKNFNIAIIISIILIIISILGFLLIKKHVKS